GVVGDETLGDGDGDGDGAGEVVGAGAAAGSGMARPPLRVAATGAAHGINIKLAKAGMLGALQIIAIARAAGLKLMIGCMLETLPGNGAAVHFACGTGAFDYLDLDSHMLVGIETPGLPFEQRGDELRVRADVPGTGWQPRQASDSGS
ncbi:MAG TPA: enolase C-terminal domain-like protein, partial [Armatimonadota bacterium]|nr:enolase C-terminal domain-like protein [Armatimonadota bacterium]